MAKKRCIYIFNPEWATDLDLELCYFETPQQVVEQLLGDGILLRLKEPDNV